MKKFWAEIIAGLIPEKMARNRWRGLLRYGLGNLRRLKREIAKNGASPRQYVSVCAIAKDEGDYLAEWLDWHRQIGVEKVYLYDNGSTDRTNQVLQPYIDSGYVEYIPYPGYRMQMAAYEDCLRRFRFDTRWLAFIDIDEFIVPLKDADLPTFLKRLEGAPAVEINWLVYGSGGHAEKSPAPVMERFRKHASLSHPLNRNVKTIIDTRKAVTMIGCHEAACIEGYAVDSHGERVSENFREREPRLDVIRINHYAVKSREEFAEKQSRGRASGKKRNVPDEYFAQYDLNDEED